MNRAKLYFLLIAVGAVAFSSVAPFVGEWVSTQSRAGASAAYAAEVEVPGNNPTEERTVINPNLPTNIPGLEAASGPAALVANIYRFAIWIGAFLAFGAIVYGGFLWAVPMGSGERAGEGKTYITNAILGLVMLFGIYVLLDLVNPDLTNLRFPELKRLEAPKGIEWTEQGSYKCTPADPEDGWLTDDYDGPACFSGPAACRAACFEKATGVLGVRQIPGTCSPVGEGSCQVNADVPDTSKAYACKGNGNQGKTDIVACFVDKDQCEDTCEEEFDEKTEGIRDVYECVETTGAACKAGLSQGSCTADGIKNYATQNGAAYPRKNAPDLVQLMSCIESKVGSNVGSKYTWDNSHDSCNYTRGNPLCEDSKKCSHARNSCHYGGRAGGEGSLAVDYGNEAIGGKIVKAALECGAKSARCENARGQNVGVSGDRCASGANHVHVNAASCDAN